MLKRQHYILYGIIICLLMPALLINLGLMTLINDEAIRGLVALEMQLSGNYVTPTLNGEYYYNKPPLYNWLLLLSFSMTGQVNEFTLRLPTVFFLLLYLITIFYYARQHFRTSIAALSALFFLTCGRILFWDALLGLIDICFSWVMFLLFMTIFHRFRQRQFWHLFLISYALAAIGFLLKGLPAVVFQAITIVVWLVYQRAWRLLFSKYNFIGLGLFLLIVGSYYGIYHQYNSLDNVFATLLSESSKRTVVNYGIVDTITHLLTFPFEMIYHFLPWSLLVIYFFRKGVVTQLCQSDFIVYCGIIFIANIIIYWTSPEVYPRYLLMLVPLLFIVLAYLHQWHKAVRTWQYRIVEGSWILVLLLVTVGIGASLQLERLDWITDHAAKSTVLLLGALPLCYMFYRYPQTRSLSIIAILLIARIGFNWFVLPDRNANDWGDQSRQSAHAIAQQTMGQPLFVYRQKHIEEMQSFYITAARKTILPIKQDDFNQTDYYLFAPWALDARLRYTSLRPLEIRHEHKRMVLGRLIEVD